MTDVHQRDALDPDDSITVHLLRTGAAEATDRGADPPPLRKTATAYRHAFTDLTRRARLPA